MVAFCFFVLPECSGWGSSSTVLSSSGESAHPCQVPELRGKALAFSTLSGIFAEGLSNMAFIR